MAPRIKVARRLAEHAVQEQDAHHGRGARRARARGSQQGAQHRVESRGIVRFAVRSRRVVTPSGVRPATVHVAEGGSRAWRSWNDAPADVRRLRRARDPARHRRHARPRQRARPHRVGGLRDRDARGGGRRRDHARRHAAQLDPADDDARGARGQARRGERAVRGRRRVLGRRRAGQRGRARGRSSPTACAASSASSSTRGVDEFGWVGEADLAPAMPDPRARSACRCSCTPSSPGRSTRPRADGSQRADPRRYATYLASRPPAAEDEAIALVMRLCRATRRAHARRAPLGGERAAAAARRARRGPAAHRRDVPALPALRGGGDPRRRDAVQVRAADPRRREPRGAVARARRRRARARRERSLAVHAGASRRSSTGDFVAAWGGIAALQLALSGRVDRGAARAGSARRARALDERGAGAARGARRARARSRPGCDADLVVFDADAARDGRRRELVQHRHKVTPYAGETLRGARARDVLARHARSRDDGRVVAESRWERSQ